MRAILADHDTRKLDASAAIVFPRSPDWRRFSVDSPNHKVQLSGIGGKISVAVIGFSCGRCR